MRACMKDRIVRWGNQVLFIYIIYLTELHFFYLLICPWVRDD